MALITRIAANIRKHRKMKSISQAKLAEMCDTSTSYIGSLETGKNKPKIATIEKIAKALGVQVEELFFENTTHQKNTLEDKLVSAMHDTIRRVLHKERK